MNRQVIFNTTLETEVHLPKLPVSSELTNIVIRQRRIPFQSNWGRDEWDCIGAPDDVTFFWIEAGAFRIAGGELIEYTPVPGASNEIIVDSLLGECLAVALLQKDRLVLHASVVAWDNEAVLFLGESGAGKSSLAFLATQDGAAAMSDDLAVIHMKEVLCGLPQLHVWPELLEQHSRSPEDYELVYPGASKRVVRYAISPDASTVKVAFVVEPGNSFKIQALQGSEKLVALLSHGFPAHLKRNYDFDFVDKDGEAWFFAQCIALVQDLDVYRVTRPQRLLTVSEIEDLRRYFPNRR